MLVREYVFLWWGSRQQYMNKVRRNHPKDNLSQLLAGSWRNHSVERQPLLSCLAEGSMHLARSDDKRLEEVSARFTTNLKCYERYYLQLMQQEKWKYRVYFEQLIKIVAQELKVGLQYIDSCISNAKHEFSRKRAEIEYLQHTLRLNEQWRKEKVDKKIQKIEETACFHIEMLDLQLGPLQIFRNDIKKYALAPIGLHSEPGGKSIKDSGQKKKDYDKDPKDQRQEKSKAVEQGTQTQLIPQNPEPMDSMEGLQELCCDQQLGRKLSSSARRRRKYAVVRRDVIREQDQFSESSVLSEG